MSLISCDMHDHFEVACMRRSKVKLELNGGQIVLGIAVDIITRQRQEYLVLKDNEQIFEIDLTTINRLNIIDVC